MKNEHKKMIKSKLEESLAIAEDPSAKRYTHEEIFEPLRKQYGYDVKMTREEMFGCMRGQFKMADDFDAPLEDFKEYMYTDDELRNMENKT